MNAAAHIKTYEKVGNESAAITADPHKLIAMLYQGALLAVANAKNAMLRKDIAGRGASISKAISIIDDGLLASLDKSAGGDLALNLAALYEYMSRRLLIANLNSDMDALDEVARLLNDLKGAWESIRTTVNPTVAAAQMQSAATARPLAANTQNPASAAPVPVATVQQRAANKVQMAYGRM